MALDFFAGCVGGAAGIIVGHPLDTVKVRIQTQCPNNPKYSGTFHCLTSTIRQESIAGLYKGILPPLYGVTAVNALVFGVYGVLKPWISGPGNDALWAHFVAGAVSGSVQSVIASPMELVKTRMQLDESGPNAKGKSAWDVLKSVYSLEGGLRRGIFKGWCITLSREIPGLGTYFATYEALTAKSGREITTLEMMMAGGMAGVVSWVACFPMDVIKTRLQSDVQGKYTGAIDCYRQTVTTEGYRALFRGLNSTVIRAFPTNAATFTAVTWIMRLAHQTHDDFEENRVNLDGLLRQWDAVRVQDKIIESIRLQTPQYAFLSVACGLDSKNSYIHHNFSKSMIQSTTPVTTICTNVSNNPSTEKECNISQDADAIREEESKMLVSKNGIEKITDNGKSTLSSSDLTGVMGVMSGTNSGMSGLGPTKTTLNVSEISSPIRGGNSHATAYSLPADLSILAEILDLPLVIVENSLDGKPITLFNIILTWLTRSTHLTFCKCLDVLDHCVCYR